MAAQSGTKVSETGISRFARAVRFAAWVTAALGIFAGVLLLPAYARLLTANYQRGCLDAELACAEKLIEAQDKLIVASRTDVVLTQRLARSQLGLVPQTELVAIAPAGARPAPPAVLSPQRPAYPPPPPRWIIAMGERLVRAPLRRGLMLLAAGALFAAMLLNAPASKLARNHL